MGTERDPKLPTAPMPGSIETEDASEAFLVEATDTRFKQGAPERVDAALESMVAIAGRELISPAEGTAWDPALHDVIGKLPRGPYRAGTIARVAVRGLRGGPRRPIKAKVFLNDD